ncbi:hypothetical protein KQI38_07370 [Tissierella carlieri]|uniref:Uncharacterized protein n=1 Tax=Tissierella carlieri TaxID=689904 RepID=A0ABT1SFR7_9FIRM|nr:hypothetical protein [Tissierella carlieri]MBU5311845.1 hypothetical protein [Tissierella carlieri]MCQ4925332.1 hypothetical protein [Tissierella carlieri]MDU5082112.1 hypothetical protein [Bacillota bacterium]
MKTEMKRILKIVLGILIIILPYIYANGDIKGYKFISPMYEVYFISKVICAIAGIHMISKEI